jgi:RNA polymerase sigma-70 factor (ECF subfamily)
MSSTSESLLVRLRTHTDTDAWSRFVELYTPLLFFWARRTGLTQDDAADLVQDVLTIVFQKLTSWTYRREKSFRGWLRTVTLNRYREIARRKKLQTEPLADGMQQIADPVQLESTWDAEYRQQLVFEAMQTMKNDFAPATWNALQQLVTNDRSAAEIARETGVSVWTIYAARNRLFTRLRRELSDLIE